MKTYALANVAFLLALLPACSALKAGENAEHAVRVAEETRVHVQTADKDGDGRISPFEAALAGTALASGLLAFWAKVRAQSANTKADELYDRTHTPTSVPKA